MAVYAAGRFSRRGREGRTGRARPLEGLVTSLSSNAIALRWLRVLRWHAVLGQLVAVGLASLVFHLRLPTGWLLGLVALTALSNAALAVAAPRNGEVPRALLGAVLLGDSLQLTAQLALSGGLSNPFSLLYLVEVSLSGLVLGSRWTLLMWGGCSSAAALLLSMPERQLWPAPTSLQLWGTWVALSLGMALTGYFTARVAGAFREREAALLQSHRRSAGAQRLGALGAQAAATAHALGSPLSSIALCSRELSDLIVSDPAQALREAAVIRSEAERCRVLLQEMGLRAGQIAGETPVEVSAGELMTAVASQLPSGWADRLRTEGDHSLLLQVPRRGLVQVLCNLVINGLQASQQPEGTVVLTSEARPGRVLFSVTDQGEGMSPELLQRLGEPFLTSKGGEGLGLGLSLAFAFAAQCGGTLSFDSIIGSGTIARLTLPSSRPGRGESPP